MLTVRTNITPGKVQKIVRDLHYINSESFIRGLALRQKADEALWFLSSIFPIGSGDHDVKEFGTRLHRGFRADYITTGKAVGFTIENVLGDDPRAATILAVLDKGSRGWEWSPDEDVRFKSRSLPSEPWVFLSMTEGYFRPARPGIHYTDRTAAYIKNKIMPELAEQFDSKVKSRMERLNGNPA